MRHISEINSQVKQTTLTKYEIFSTRKKGTIPSI